MTCPRLFLLSLLPLSQCHTLYFASDIQLLAGSCPRGHIWKAEHHFQKCSCWKSPVKAPGSSVLSSQVQMSRCFMHQICTQALSCIQQCKPVVKDHLNNTDATWSWSQLQHTALGSGHRFAVSAALCWLCAITLWQSQRNVFLCEKWETLSHHRVGVCPKTTLRQCQFTSSVHSSQHVCMFVSHTAACTAETCNLECPACLRLLVHLNVCMWACCASLTEEALYNLLVTYSFAWKYFVLALPPAHFSNV